MLTRRRFGTGALAALAGAAAGGIGLGGCALSSASCRVRMTVEVETAQGLRSGSSVYEINEYREFFRTAETHAVSAGMTGEAVAVDLPDGTLFTLLDKTEDGKLLLQAIADALAPIAKKSPEPADYLAQIRRLGAAAPGQYKAELPRIVMVDDLRGPRPKKRWPRMVRFRDINDPRTVEMVEPEAVGVKRILLEATQDPVTTGIEKRLGWMGWSSEKWIEFARDGWEPMRIHNLNGTVQSIPRNEFKKGN